MLGMRSIFYLALIPGLLAFSMVLMVRERPVAAGAKIKIGVNFRQFPEVYWRYLLATAIFGLGNSSNAFLILRTQDAGGSLDITILIYAAFNLVAALISYPAGFVSDTRGRKERFTGRICDLHRRLFGLRPRPGISPLSPGCLGLWLISGYIPRRGQGACGGPRASASYGQAALAGTAPPWVCFNL